MTELYQIYYKDEQLKEIYPFAIPYKNEGLTIFFENEIISRLAMASEAEKIAVCSWKLRMKQRYNMPCGPITKEIIESEYDVLSFTKNSKHHTMLAAASTWHPGFREALTQIVEGIGKKMPFEVKKPIYQNAFSAKREIYWDYLTDYLNPAMELIKNDPKVYALSTADSNYTQLVKKDAASAEYLQEQIGMPFYPLVPFLLERLFSIYVHNKNINVTWL